MIRKQSQILNDLEILLQEKRCYKDVMAFYENKTLTIEAFPKWGDYTVYRFRGKIMEVIHSAIGGVFRMAIPISYIDKEDTTLLAGYATLIELYQSEKF